MIQRSRLRRRDDSLGCCGNDSLKGESCLLDLCDGVLEGEMNKREQKT